MTESVSTGPSSNPPPLPPPETPRRARSRSRRLAIILPVLLVVIVSGILLWRYLNSYESTDDAQVDAHLYPVSARISGYVVAVNVEDNQWVSKGTLLVEIDPKDYEVAVAEARAALANSEATARSLGITVPITSVTTSSQIRGAEADVENSRAGIASAEKQAAAARANLTQAEANDVRIQADLPRYQQLVEKQEVSQQQYDQALAAARASTANVAGARASLAALEQQVVQAKQRLVQAQASLESARTGPRQVAEVSSRADAARADVEQKRALLDQAELNLQYTKIVAPVSGEVNKTVVLGLNVQPGQQLLTIVPLEEVWITANFKETQLRRMRPGQKSDIQVDSSGRTYQGHVDSIAGATGPLFSLLPPENATGNYVKIVQRIPVKIVLEPGENKDHLLRPGMNVVPDVHLQ